MKLTLTPMASCNGCGDCCGPVAARPEEIRRVRHLARERGESWQVDPEHPITCGFFRVDEAGNRCAVYEARPYACRAYGVIQEMTCPHFPEEAQQSLPPAEAVLMRFTDPDDRLLGEAFEPGYLERIGATIGNFKPGVVTRIIHHLRAAGVMPYGRSAFKEA